MSIKTADLVGKRVAFVELAKVGPFNEKLDKDEEIIEALVFEDGTRLRLEASGQIGIDCIWAYVEEKA